MVDDMTIALVEGYRASLSGFVQTKTVSTFVSEDEAMSFAQDRGWVQPAADDEGGAGFGVLDDEHRIVVLPVIPTQGGPDAV